MQLYTAPEQVPFADVQHTACIFLAGSIEMGKAVDWQQLVIDALDDFDVVLFNPRRTTWDTSWAQTLDNPQFCEQVNWELDQVNMSDLVFFYFQENTLSPISLMELGIALASGSQVVVVAEPGFWRRGNIEVICQRHGTPLYTTLDEGIKHLHQYLGRYL